MASEGDAPQVASAAKKRTRAEEEEEEAAAGADCCTASLNVVSEEGISAVCEDAEPQPADAVAAGDLDRVESKRARIEQDSSADAVETAAVVTEVEVVQETLKIESVELVSAAAPASPPDAAGAMDIEVKKVVDSASIDTVVEKSVATKDEDGAAGAEDAAANEGVRKGTNIPGGGKPGKKRKIAMLLAYCGAGYQGMQRNPGAITIEGELEQALFRASAIAQCNFGDLRKVDWMRAARTDKGVSAVGQVVSARLVIDPPGFVERVNEHLPKEIRVFGFTRVTSNFNAKQMCDKRRYEYVIPVFAFDPNAHHDRETVLAWTEKRELEKLQRIERRKALEKKDAVAADTLPGSAPSVDNEPITVAETGPGALNDSINGTSPPNATEEATEIATTAVARREEEENSAPPPETAIAAELREECTTAVADEAAEPEVKPEDQPPFVFGEAQLKRLNSVLGRYCGTHNFHNFTARVKPEDPSAKRYILSFEARDVFEVQGMQFVRCTVVGQSFMLHQIRKMIGMAIAIMRGCAPDTIINTALRRDTDVNVPMAPELGLFLDECYYTAYNSKFKNTHEEVTQKGFEKEILDFKREVVYAHIATTEVKDGTMAMWLRSLNDRSYPDFVIARDAAKPQ